MQIPIQSANLSYVLFNELIGIAGLLSLYSRLISKKWFPRNGIADRETVHKSLRLALRFLFSETNKRSYWALYAFNASIAHGSSESQLHSLNASSIIQEESLRLNRIATINCPLALGIEHFRDESDCQCIITHYSPRPSIPPIYIVSKPAMGKIEMVLKK